MALELTNLDRKAHPHEVELYDRFKHIDDLLNMRKERLGLELLRTLIDLEDKFAKDLVHNSLSISNFKYHHPDIAHHGSASQKTDKVVNKLTDTWKWLINQGYITYTQNNHHIRITDEGRKATSENGEVCFRVLNGRPLDLVHPSIRKEAENYLLNALYTDVVSYVFKEIEDLLKKHRLLKEKHSSILNLAKSVLGEGNLASLVANSFTEYRNPVSHSNLHRESLSSLDALHQVQLASLLLYEIDKRIKTKGEHQD